MNSKIFATKDKPVLRDADNISYQVQPRKRVPGDDAARPSSTQSVQHRSLPRIWHPDEANIRQKL
jgi:hypothetical protein